METLLFGKVQHLHQKLNEALKAKENDDLVFTVSAAITQELPEEALEELEESLQPDNDNDESLWSRVTAPEMECSGWRSSGALTMLLKWPTNMLRHMQRKKLNYQIVSSAIQHYFQMKRRRNFRLHDHTITKSSLQKMHQPSST